MELGRHGNAVRLSQQLLRVPSSVNMTCPASDLSSGEIKLWGKVTVKNVTVKNVTVAKCNVAKCNVAKCNGVKCQCGEM